MAGGLTLGELVALEDEYGSLDAVAEARPELADEIRAWQQQWQRVAAHLAPTLARARAQSEALAKLTTKLTAAPAIRPNLDPRPLPPTRSEQLLEQLNMTVDEAVRQLAQNDAGPKKPGRKSRWRRSELEAITKRLAAGESARSIGLDLGIHHQRISELKARGDTYWDTKARKLVTPEGTKNHPEEGYYVLPSVPK